MVAIRSDSADEILARPLGSMRIILFFGQDTGLVFERANALVDRIGIDRKDPFQLINLDGNEVTSNPALLVDEVKTISLFNARRVIWVRNANSDFSSALHEVINIQSDSCAVFIEAGPLKKDAGVRRFCEASRYALSIECTQDSEESLKKLLDRELALTDISADAGTKSAIIRALGADRLSTRMELSKLTTYAHDSRIITERDVETLLADASSIALEQTIHFAFSGKLSGAEESWNRLLATGIDSSTVLLTALREITALHLFANEADSGPFNLAQQKYIRTAYGRKPLTENSLKRWSLPRCKRAIEILAEAQKRSRRESSIAREIAIRALWSICVMIRQN